MSHVQPPIARFYRLIPDACPPQRADRSAGGTLPTRAYRHCDAVTSAAGFGWWLYPPCGISLMWDGAAIFWQCDARPEWMPLAPAAQYPHQSARFDAAAPAALQGCSPPFLTALPEPGAVQVWTGFLVRSAPGWGLLVRAPANLPAAGGYEQWEGIVEAEDWFGPVFSNLRLTRTDRPVVLQADRPLVQVQPLPHAAYAEATLRRTGYVPDLAGLTAADWADYDAAIAAPNADPTRPPGGYAAAVRRRRRAGCPGPGPGPGPGPEAGSGTHRGIVGIDPAQQEIVGLRALAVP